MRDKLKHIVMTFASIPISWAGLEAWLHGATTLVGFATSCCGLVMGMCGAVWWVRKLRGGR